MYIKRARLRLTALLCSPLWRRSSQRRALGVSVASPSPSPHLWGCRSRRCGRRSFNRTILVLIMPPVALHQSLCMWRFYSRYELDVGSVERHGCCAVGRRRGSMHHNGGLHSVLLPEAEHGQANNNLLNKPSFGFHMKWRLIDALGTTRGSMENLGVCTT